MSLTTMTTIGSVTDDKYYHGKGLTGLINLGNTCYMNSAMQCLSACQPLTKYFLSGNFKEDINLRKKEYKMCKEFYRLLVGMWEENCIVKPVSFKQTLSHFNCYFSGWLQHDSQEAMSALIELLHLSTSYEVVIEHKGEAKNELDKLAIESIESWNKCFKNEYSNIVRIFYGQYHQKLSCDNCNFVSNTYDPFCVIQVPIEDNSTLSECLLDFSAEEKLSGDNVWRCEKCKENKSSKKKMEIWKAPNVLIVQLKRFRFGKDKLRNLINYPLVDLAINDITGEYESDDLKYDLFAVNCHIGGVFGGHYFAYCKNANGKWYEFNDADVQEITDKAKIITENAYLLIYQKK